MTDDAEAADSGWFSGLNPDDADADSDAITAGPADQPADWPALAVESGFADSKSAYYERLREATLAAAREGVREREAADDQQLIHAVRALDDTRRVANELTERVAEWAGTRDADAAVDRE